MQRLTKPENLDSLSKKQQEIYEWLSNLKFRKKTFGGVDEADVWSKIGELNALYEKLLIAERANSSSCVEADVGGDKDDE